MSAWRHRHADCMRRPLEFGLESCPAISLLHTSELTSKFHFALFTYRRPSRPSSRRYRKSRTRSLLQARGISWPRVAWVSAAPDWTTDSRPVRSCSRNPRTLRSPTSFARDRMFRLCRAAIAHERTSPLQHPSRMPFIGERPAPQPWREIVAACEPSSCWNTGQCGHVGGIFRNAAAFGADSILLDRPVPILSIGKAIRTSMGAALLVPFARSDDPGPVLRELREGGFATIAMDPPLPRRRSVLRCTRLATDPSPWTWT